MQARTFLIGAIAGCIVRTSFTGCSTKNDTVSQAAKADKKAGVAAPSIAETKAMAEEGFIHDHV